MSVEIVDKVTGNRLLRHGSKQQRQVVVNSDDTFRRVYLPAIRVPNIVNVRLIHTLERVP